MTESKIVRRVNFDRNRLRGLMYAQGYSTSELAEKTGIREKTLYTNCSNEVMMPDQLSRIASVLGCSVEYLTGEDDELNRPDKQVTCSHCGYCRLYHDYAGSRLICTKWHIYRVEEDDHCSWGEWRSLKELMNDD